MNLLISRNQLVLILTILLLLSVASLLGFDFVLPLALLSASGNSSCGNGMGGAGAGGGFGNCGSTGGGSTGGSTPFLCTWDGAKYNLENDILFGKPVSLFPTEAQGRTAYEKNQVIGDYYKIKNTVIAKDGFLSFQIKEIEPEESFIDYLSLTKIIHDENGYLVTGSDFRNHLVFEKKSLETNEGISDLTIKDIAGQSVAAKLAQPFEVSNKIRLETTESLFITAKVSNPDRPLYLLLGSQYRDWTAGEIKQLNIVGGYSFIQSKVREILSENNSKSFLRKSVSVVSMVFVLTVLWAVGQVQTLVSQDDHEDSSSKLASAFGTKKAYADVPSTGGGGGGNGGGGGKSLNVEFKSMNGEYQLIDIVQPRYLQTNLEAVLVPPSAISSNGAVELRVTATKRHDVTNVVLVSPSKLLSSESTEMKVSKATLQRTGEDFADKLNSRLSGDYLHIVPADVIDIEFGPASVNAVDGQQEVYLISAHGFYTPLSAETRDSLGDWVNRLDAESLTALKGMYSLNSYYNSDRKTILS